MSLHIVIVLTARIINHTKHTIQYMHYVKKLYINMIIILNKYYKK